MKRTLNKFKEATKQANEILWQDAIKNKKWAYVDSNGKVRRYKPHGWKKHDKIHKD